MDGSDTIFHKTVPVFNDVLLPRCTGLKCVTQFVAVFQISRENKPVQSYFCIMNMLVEADLMGIIVNPIFCGEI